MNKNITLKVILIFLIIILLLTSCSWYKTIDKGVNGEETEGGINKYFDSKQYIINDNYGVALSILENSDMSRPDENTRWLKKLKIRYPQLYNMSDEEKEKRINDILFKEALNIRDVINERTYVEYDIDYEIMDANKEVLSIFFTGYSQTPVRYNRIGYAITIDLEKERFIELSEIFKIDEEFMDVHLHKDFQVVDNNFDKLSDNNPFVEEYLNNYNLLEHFHDFYIKDGKLGLIIPAPQTMGYIILESEIGKN